MTPVVTRVVLQITAGATVHSRRWQRRLVQLALRLDGRLGEHRRWIALEREHHVALESTALAHSVDLFMCSCLDIDASRLGLEQAHEVVDHLLLDVPSPVLHLRAPNRMGDQGTGRY